MNTSLRLSQDGKEFEDYSINYDKMLINNSQNNKSFRIIRSSEGKWIFTDLNNKAVIFLDTKQFKQINNMLALESGYKDWLKITPIKLAHKSCINQRLIIIILFLNLLISLWILIK